VDQEVDEPLDSAAAEEVTEQAVKLFGDSSVAKALEEPTWDIDVESYETHDRVEYYISRFTGAARAHLQEQLSRGTRYEGMIRSKLRAGGLPEDMTYLALIESGYDPNAYSRAAAVGMWQFMTTTAKGVGLRVDWWVDERRDPVRSTDAAVKFLGYLNDQFGSLYLAAAAYNGGPGRVSRGLHRYADALSGAEGEDVFFALAEKDYLRAETRDYVPKLIAAAIVAKEPARYGMSVERLEPFEYDSARVGPSTPLAAVARASGVSLEQIMELNSEILRGLTPPKDSFTVRIPVGTAEWFSDSLRALPDSLRLAYRTVTSKKGDTRTTLARAGGITVSQLSAYNRSLKVARSGRVVSGQKVLLPRKYVLAAALDVPDPSIERYGSSGGRTTTHVVRKGESLSVIARRYKTTVASIKQLNGLKKTVIYPGQVIVVKSSGATYTVRRGDTLGEIAQRHGMTLSELKRLNGMKGDMIRAGQKLRVAR
jgi:membrane-bound lytic murein transglycosylase D